MKAPLPPNETRRLAALRGYDVLDTLPERAFDDLTLLAAQICQTPIALVSLVDENRQWFKSTHGLNATETPRDLAFCAHAILHSDEILEVLDAQLDPRFADNPLVTADPHIRFYAGAPLVTSDGLALGTLCVIDRVPRVLSAEQRAALRALSHTVIAQLELRRTVVAYQRTQAQLQSLNTSLEQQVEARTVTLQLEMEARREIEQQLLALSTMSSDWFWQQDEEFRFTEFSGAFASDFTPPANSLGKTRWELNIDLRPEQWAAHRTILDAHLPFRDFEYPISDTGGEVRWYSVNGEPVFDKDNRFTGYHGTGRNITEKKQVEESLRIAATAFETQQGMMITDANKVIVRVNRAFTEITGYTAEEAVGQTPRLLQSGRHDQDFYRAMWETIRRTGAWQGEIWDRRKNGEIYPKLLTIAAVKTDSGAVTHYVCVHTDISEHKKAEEALLNKGHLLSESQRIGHLGSWHLDLSTRELTWSDETYRICGVSPDTFSLNVESSLNLMHPDDRASMQAWIADCAAGAKHDELEFRINRPDGTVRVLSGYGELQYDAASRQKNLIGIVHDVTARKAAEEQITFLAYRDALTGLPNRALLKDRTTHTISMVQRAAEPMTMMLVGIDHFKTINDTLGHDIGDELLVEMAKRLSDSVRDQDTVARLGGEEFVLVLPGTPASGAAHLATELLWRLAQPHQLGGHELTLTASIGIASYPDNGGDFDSLFKAVEITLHRVQTSKRNSFQFYSADMYQEMLARDHMMKALRNAVALDQLQLAYQPLVDLQTGQISSLEALLRWQHPELGAVSPAQFIPLAEESDLIKGIGEWVLRRACRDIRTWLDKDIKVPHVAVNVSPLQFHDPDLIAQVKSALSDFQVDPGLVYLEVTESALMDDVPRSEAMLKELKGLGVKLSLDDFGTGYSSLSYLKRFPFDKVKIDQSFVRDITISQSDQVIVKVIVSMAHGLGLKVIAEGVETEAQCEIMRTSVCDEIQGYFFSRPISAQAIEELFSEGRQLPPHLLRLQKPQRTLLLVDDEPNIVASLKRLFRRDGHVILTANSGPEGLDALSKHKVDVIISDQRMPGMTGVEFLRAAKVNYPDTIRIVLSGYTELQSVTDAINEGAVYRFLTKPWEDEQLREQIQKAFEHKELQEENRLLDLRIRSTNQELVAANRQLGEVLQETRHQIERDETSLAIVREALQHIPLPVIGVDDEGLMVFVNAAAQRLFAQSGPLLGVELAYALPAIDAVIAGADEGVPCELQMDHGNYLVRWNTMGANSQSRGRLVTLNKVELNS